MHRQRATKHGRQRRHGAQGAVQITVDARAHGRAELVTHGGKRHQRRRARAQALNDTGHVKHLKRGRGRAQRRAGQIGHCSAQGNGPTSVAVRQGADQHLAQAHGKDE
ncbi:hypothetical protein D3C87_1512510 [compost metagenome]